MRRWLGVIGVGVMLVAGACGSSGDDDGATATTATEAPAQVLLASASKTAEAKSSKATSTITIQGAQGLPGGEFTSTGEGAYDFTTREGAFTLTLPPIGGVEIGRVDAVLTGPVLYQKFPPQLAQALGGKPWVKIDLNDLGQASGVDFSSLIQYLGDPTQALQLLRGAGAETTEVGQERLRGESVTHYRATFDVGKAAAAAPPDQQKALQQLSHLFGGRPLRAEVWIDEEQRLRKLSYSLDLARLNLPAQAPPAARPTGTLALVTEFFDFGTPVSVTVPPADQVTDLGGLIGQRRSSGHP